MRQRSVGVDAETVGDRIAIPVGTVGERQFRRQAGHFGTGHGVGEVERLRRIVEQVGEEAAVGPRAVERAAAPGAGTPPVPGVVVEVVRQQPVGRLPGCRVLRNDSLGDLLGHRGVGIEFENDIHRRIVTGLAGQHLQCRLQALHLRTGQRRLDGGRSRARWRRIGLDLDRHDAGCRQCAIAGGEGDRVGTGLALRRRPVEQCATGTLRRQGGADSQGGGGDRYRFTIRAAGFGQEGDLLHFLDDAVRHELQHRWAWRADRILHRYLIDAGRVDVEEIDPVLPVAGIAILCAREPDVLDRDRLGIGTHHVTDRLGSTERIGETHIDEALRCRHGHAVARLTVSSKARRCRQIGHHRVGAFRLIDADDVAVLGEEIADQVAARQVDAHVADEQVRIGALQDGGERAAEFVRMAEGRRELDELAGQRALHEPAAHAGGV